MKLVLIIGLIAISNLAHANPTEKQAAEAIAKQVNAIEQDFSKRQTAVTANPKLLCANIAPMLADVKNLNSLVNQLEDLIKKSTDIAQDEKDNTVAQMDAYKAQLATAITDLNQVQTENCH